VSGAVRAKVDVDLSYDQPADEASAAVLARLQEVITDNLEGAIADSDDEYLHQLRIAVRRSRTVQRQFAGVFPAIELPGFRSEFRWLQLATGEARDLDVYVADLDLLRDMLPADQREDLEPLRPVLVARRQAARTEMARALRSTRTVHLLDDWGRLVQTLVELPRDDRPDAESPIGALAGRRIRRVYGRIVKMGSAIDASSPPQDYHDLRKKGKELRYLLELFAVRLFGEETVNPMIRSLKGLQDLLGRHQDREVQVAMLRSRAPEVAAMPGGPAACMAMGVLIERLRADERAARVEFADSFAGFSSESQRELVGGTFR
jgi:CHAD domain-containing protein